MKRLALVLALVTMSACNKPEQQAGQQSQMADTSSMMMSADTSQHMMMSDTSKHMMADTSKAMAKPPAKKP